MERDVDRSTVVARPDHRRGLLMLLAALVIVRVKQRKHKQLFSFCRSVALPTPAETHVPLPSPHLLMRVHSNDTMLNNLRFKKFLF